MKSAVSPMLLSVLVMSALLASVGCGGSEPEGEVDMEMTVKEVNHDVHFGSFEKINTEGQVIRLAAGESFEGNLRATDHGCPQWSFRCSRNVFPDIEEVSLSTNEHISVSTEEHKFQIKANEIGTTETTLRTGNLSAVLSYNLTFQACQIDARERGLAKNPSIPSAEAPSPSLPVTA